MKEIKELLKQIESSKIRLAHERDKLRALVEEVTELIDITDRGVESIDIGLRELEGGIDTLSEKV